MATITITIPDDKLNAIIDSFATAYNYQAIIDGQANPTSKPNFAKNIIKTYIIEVHRSAKLKDLETERQTIISEADSDTSGITVS